MKLLRVHVIRADTCGGLLDELNIWLRDHDADYGTFDPLCLVGPNGSGKSQFLQVIAEIFQSVFRACVPNEERVEGNADVQFEVEYLIRPEPSAEPLHVRLSRKAEGKKRPKLYIETLVDGEWMGVDPKGANAQRLLPVKVVGYTSGDNETLSLPFLISRSGYAEEVGQRALSTDRRDEPVPDTRLMLIDYGTHLEVLVANLLLAKGATRRSLLRFAQLNDVHSFRCVIQLAHGGVKKLASRRAHPAGRKGVQLTPELEAYIDRLQRCATAHRYDPVTETYVFDFYVTDATRTAFHAFWGDVLDLYSAFHKLSMLNDLAIPRPARERFKRDTKSRRFASRLPEPQDEDKIFRFERVRFTSHKRRVESDCTEVVDYVSLSDGEHQMAQLLGTFSMLSFPNVLFLLDEPESHFNPQWRVRFIAHLFDLPTINGRRGERSVASHQDCLLTTHAPFVPSDMHREKVFIFAKDNGRLRVDRPDIETYGTTFDTILEQCFDVRPPISRVSLREIETLMQSSDADVVQAGIERLGDSVEKVFLMDHLRDLTKGQH